MAAGESLLDRVGRREDRLAQHDEREEPVALGDVVRVPGCTCGALGPHRHRQLAQHTQRPQVAAQRQRHEQERAPREHHAADTDGVAPGRRACGRVRASGAHPLRHEADAHDGVAERGHGEVVRLEGRGHTGREHQHAGHLHERGGAIERVVGVVGRGEPRVVHPRPPDAEERHHEAEHARGDVALDDGVVEVRRRERHRHHEAQIEQQLERRRDAALLVWVTRPHRHAPPALVPMPVRHRGSSLGSCALMTVTEASLCTSSRRRSWFVRRAFRSTSTSVWKMRSGMGHSRTRACTSP